MSKKLFLLTAYTFCFFGPFACFGMEATTNTQVMPIQMDKNVTVSQSITNSFVNDAALAPYAGNVIVRVDNGVVTLSGAAPTEKIKFDFANKAKTTGGVTKVVNNIEVKQGVNVK